jgi:tight adherence protein B
VSLPIVLLVLLTVLFVLGVIVAVLPVDEPDLEAAPNSSSFDRSSAVQVAAAAALGLVVVAVSGWLVPGLVIGAATWYWVGAWQRRNRSGSSDVERTDALASWIENLRDVLLAGDQPIGAIAATVPTAPLIIRPAVRRLSAALGHQDPDTAFRRFADELDDPLGDLVSAGLLIAVERGARTVAVLTALAEQARTQADRRRIVDAERAPIQREVMLLSLIMGGLVVALVVFGRGDYLDAYDTAGGQTFLSVVLAIYAVLLLRVQRLARFPKPSRFLTTAGARVRPGATSVGSSR